MIMIGNRIRSQIKRPSSELIEKFRGIPSSNIGDMMHRLFCMDASIRAMSQPPLLGSAITVRLPEGDNVFLHLAMELAQPGDVIVVDGSGCETRALMGEMMFTYAKALGISGFVLDGAIRDVDSLIHLDLPVYARGVTPQGPLKNGGGEINYPISCGGQVVRPGDILVGDGDGICVIPQEDAESIYTAAREKYEGEQQRLEEYRKGLLDRAHHAETYESIARQIRTTYC